MTNGSKNKESRFSISNSIQLIALTGLYAGAIGTALTAFFISPADFQKLIFQHIYESASILGGTILAVTTFEGLKGKDTYDDLEILVFIGVITAFALFGHMIGLGQIAGPWYPVYNLNQPFAIQYGLLAVIEASIGIGITVVLEKYTEVI